MTDGRPEDARSYDEFENALGKERAALIRYDASPRAGIPWALASLALPLSFVFVLGSVVGGRHTPWWEWVCGLFFLALFVLGVWLLVRHHEYRRRRLKEMTRLEDEWQQRALRGEVPLAAHGGPLRNAEIRHHIEFVRALRDGEPPPPSWCLRLMTASLVCVGLGVVTLIAGVGAAAFGAPRWTAWVVVVAMPGFGAIGFALAVVSRIRGRRENRDLVAGAQRRAEAAVAAMRREAAKGRPSG